jgi:Trypsin
MFGARRQRQRCDMHQSQQASLLLGLIFTACAVLQPTTAYAIIIRHDVPDSEYRVDGDEFPWLVDLPGEGHGALIANRWVVTAAHTTRWQLIKEVTINAKARVVAHIIVHPGYKAPLPALSHGDAAPLMAFNLGNDDIALIELQQPVGDVKPVELYRASDESGKVVKIAGKGATGNGQDGQYPHAAHRGALRRAFNRIISTDERWLNYRFVAPPAAPALEGMLGDGDSGGPVLIEANGAWKLAGLASWKRWTGDLSEFRTGVYGQISSHVRISHYVAWIESVIGSGR